MSTREADETGLDGPVEIQLSRQDALLIESLLWRVQEAPVAEHLVRDRAYAMMLNEALSRFVTPAAEIRAELSRRLEEINLESDGRRCPTGAPQRLKREEKPAPAAKRTR